MAVPPPALMPVTTTWSWTTVPDTTLVPWMSAGVAVSVPAWICVSAVAEHTGTWPPPTSLRSAVTDDEERLVNRTLLKQPVLIPNSERSIPASRKSRGGTLVSPAVPSGAGASPAPLTSRHLLAVLASDGSHTGMFQGGALASVVALVKPSLTGVAQVEVCW